MENLNLNKILERTDSVNKIKNIIVGNADLIKFHSPPKN
jgi:hypothetical protein